MLLKCIKKDAFYCVVTDVFAKRTTKYDANMVNIYGDQKTL